jgi:hypothetical protein
MYSRAQAPRITPTNASPIRRFLFDNGFLFWNENLDLAELRDVCSSLDIDPGATTSTIKIAYAIFESDDVRAVYDGRKTRFQRERDRQYLGASSVDEALSELGINADPVVVEPVVVPVTPVTPEGEVEQAETPPTPVTPEVTPVTPEVTPVTPEVTPEVVAPEPAVVVAPPEKKKRGRPRKVDETSDY